MGGRDRDVTTALVLVVLMVLSGIPVSLAGAGGAPGTDGAPEADGGSRGGPAPMDVGPWVDEFDDTSKIEIAQGTEVVSGEVRLLAGETTGLVASVSISAPAGYKYDMLVLDVRTPGDSKVLISVLNATEDSTQVGYVNEPILGFTKQERTQVPLTISPRLYPELRLQADLEANGTDRPALLRWAVHFSPLDMYVDDFLGDAKITKYNRLVFDGNTVSLDLSMQNLYGTGYGDHSAYPTIIANRYSDSNNRLEMGVFYTNTAGTGYQARTQLAAENPQGFVVDDLDVDGNLDLVVANYRDGMDYTRSSWILWGDSANTWDPVRRTELYTDRGRTPALGDVDGDGLLDVLIACGGGGSPHQVRVFINTGNRTWNPTHDVALPGDDIRGLASADLNGDGYDDVVLAENYDPGTGASSRIYMGDAGGIDTTADITLRTGLCHDVVLEDFNKDGFPDVAFANTVDVGGNDRALVYMGGIGGPDTNDDFQAEVRGSDWGLCVAAGDVDGDGWLDLVFGRIMQQPRMYVFTGSTSGFSNARRDDPRIFTSMNDVLVIDLNMDGFADVLGAGSYQDRVDVYLGSSSGPDGTSDLNLDTNQPTSLAVAVPRKKYNFLEGTFVTDIINRPMDMKWDLLYLDGTFPENTTSEVTILDSGKVPIIGYSGLSGPDVDLSGVSIPAIHVQVTLRSLDKVTTPRIDRMFLNWMPKDVWREEFYGKAKVGGLQGFTVTSGELQTDPLLGGEEELVFANLRNDASFSVPSIAFRDSGGLDYNSMSPIRLNTGAGSGGVDVSDINGDGFLDVALAVTQTSDSNYLAESQIFLGSPVGFGSTANARFSTKGARDVAVADINEDGFPDVVFAEEFDGSTYMVNSSLYWGKAGGWNTTPSVRFQTSGASGVELVDLNKDGLLDVVFACYRDDTTTSVDSLAFLQGPSGFDGASPNHHLPTRGARRVVATDLDRDNNVDLVFANSLSTGLPETDSWIYWGATGGGFEVTPGALPTVGATDVEAADLNGDSHMDLVFACGFDRTGNRLVDSRVYLGHGTRSFASTPDVTLPTVGASGVVVADLDDTGWRDLVFSCQFNGVSYEVDSRVFLGGASGYGSSPDIEVPTWGASDVVVAHLVPKDAGGYVSKLITPANPTAAGVFEVFKYNALALPTGGGKVQILDATTGALLAETPLKLGSQEWTLADKFRIREHPAIRVMLVGNGIDPGTPRSMAVDDLWLNWSPRNMLPPKVLDLQISKPTVLRTQNIGVTINVSDEYDFPSELTVRLEHRRTNTTDPWNSFMISGLGWKAPSWAAVIAPRVDIPVGVYDLRVLVTDRDGMTSDWQLFAEAFEVLNNIPSAPVVRIDPPSPTTTSTLEAIIVTDAKDIESTLLTYVYMWYLDGELVTNLTTQRVTPTWTAKGQNWTVNVRANDSNDLGPAGSAWKIIQNAAPEVGEDLPDPKLSEDLPDTTWLDLTDAFVDPDGDPLTWKVEPVPRHIQVEIDEGTGAVTLTPEPNWWGSEEITFWASDSEFSVSQVVTVAVANVNDPPTVASVNGVPWTGGTVEVSVDQGQEMVITFVVSDLEGDDLIMRVDTSKVSLFPDEFLINWTPGNDDVGWLNFTLSINDNVDTAQKVIVPISVRIADVNDIMGDPRIISPSKGESFKWNESVGLRAVCEDPDTKHGQVLNFTWRSNQTGLLGHEASLNFRFRQSGSHNITLEVTDGEFTKSAWVVITVGEEPVPPPPPPPEEEEDNLMLILAIVIIAVLVVVGAVFVLSRRRRATEEEAAAKVMKPTPEELAERERREALTGMAAAMRATADKMEEDRAAERAKKEETIEVAGTGMVPGAASATKMRLSEKASDETARLWKDMAEEKPAIDEAEKEALRRESERRKIQSAIQALPYGIPAPDLRHIPPNLLAEEIVAGPKHELPDGRVLVTIRGKWYHGDPEDSSSFLMPYKEKVPPKPSADASEWEEA